MCSFRLSLFTGHVTVGESLLPPSQVVKVLLFRVVMGLNEEIRKHLIECLPQGLYVVTTVFFPVCLVDSYLLFL